MFCSRCGTQVDTSVRFCPNCGQDLSALTGAGKTTPISAQPPQENETDIVREGLKDEYELEKELGRGGMAVVYKARDKQLDREVAIKVLPFSLSFDAEFVERFQREARTAGKLEHPNIIPIYRVGKAGRVIYFVMKFIRGKSLSQVIEARGALPVPEIRRLLKEATSALGYAHKHGIVHRDIKPDNIMFDEQGQAIVTDFGIAKAQSGAKLTGTGMSIGTPHYMSPEQARAQNLDGRSDIYSLGVVGYQALTGHVPFDGEDSFSIGYKHIMEELPVPSLEHPDQRDLFGIVQRMMAKKPDDRFQNADELVAALEAGAGQVPMQDLSTMRTVAIESPVKKPAAPPMASMATTPLPRASASLGKPRDTVERDEAPTRASPARQPEKPSFRPKETTPKKSNAVPIGIAAVLIIAVGGLGGYLYLQKQKQNEQQTHQVAANTPPVTQSTPADTSKAAAPTDTAKAPATTPPAPDTAKAVTPAPTRTPATTHTPATSRTHTPATSRTPTAVAVTPPATGGPQGTIALSNLPNGARITLNGQPKSGQRFKVPAGQYTLEIQAQGFQPYSNRVTVQPGQTVPVQVAMVAGGATPVPAATPVAAGARDPQCSSNPSFSTTNARKQCWDTRPIANTPTVLPPPGACTGNVTPAQVLVHVSVQGEVVGAPTVRQRSNCAAFNDGAVAQVQEITFTPARKGGTPVDAWVVVRMVPQRQ